MAFTTVFCILIVVAFMAIQPSYAKVKCNSTVGTDQVGECTGDYCFNIEDNIRGCVNFYRMIRDDNIACGHMHLLGNKTKVCVCTQPYCGNYASDNMPMQTLAKVNCTDDTSPDGYCHPGPCYVGNDLHRYGLNRTDDRALQRTCMPDWFAVTNFKQLIMYEVPPLAKHSACFFDSDGLYNCMCKDPDCNKQAKPSLNQTTDDQYFTCHKVACNTADTSCTETYLGNDTCVGQMCYYLRTHYDFSLNGNTYNEGHFVRDCLNYSHANPINDLTFVTRFEFGKSSSDFYPCRENWCNAQTSDQSTTVDSTVATPPTSGSAVIVPSILVTFMILFCAFMRLE